MTYLSFNPLRPLARAGARFRDDEAASISVETVMVLPLLLWAFLATYTYFDVYRHKSLALKANYAISDLLSRETNPVNMNYLLGAEKVFAYLTQDDESTWLRVTVVHCEEECAEPTRVLKGDWSRATDGLPTFDDAEIMDQLEPIIPWIASGERVIIVESSVHYDPPFSSTLTGVKELDFRDIIMTRPRFAPQLCWEGVGCGA